MSYKTFFYNLAIFCLGIGIIFSGVNIIFLSFPSFSYFVIILIMYSAYVSFFLDGVCIKNYYIQNKFYGREKKIIEYEFKKLNKNYYKILNKFTFVLAVLLPLIIFMFRPRADAFHIDIWQIVILFITWYASCVMLKSSIQLLRFSMFIFAFEKPMITSMPKQESIWGIWLGLSHAFSIFCLGIGITDFILKL